MVEMEDEQGGREIAMKLSSMFNMTLQDVAAVTTSNTEGIICRRLSVPYILGF